LDWYCVTGVGVGAAGFLNGHLLLVEWLDEEACIIYKIRGCFYGLKIKWPCRCGSMARENQLLLKGLPTWWNHITEGLLFKSMDG